MSFFDDRQFIFEFTDFVERNGIDSPPPRGIFSQFSAVNAL